MRWQFFLLFILGLVRLAESHSYARKPWPDAKFPPVWSSSSESPGANAGACTWLHYIAQNDAQGNVSQALEVVLEALASITESALKSSAIPVGLLDVIAGIKKNVSDRACSHPPVVSNVSLPWHPWLQSTEGSVGDLAHHKVLLETPNARLLNVHSDVGHPGVFHTHGAFSIAVTYGFPMVIRQWDLQNLDSNIPEAECFKSTEMHVSFLPPTWLHRVMPKGCMSFDAAPNCPMDVAPHCGPGMGHTGFFFRLEISKTTPTFVDVVNPPAPSLPPSLPYSMDMTSYIRRGGGDLLTQRVQYRFGHHQGLWSTLSADDARSKTCNVLFDTDGSVWEWYDDVQECAKVFAGIPVMPPDFYAAWRKSFMHKTVQNPFTNQKAIASAVCMDNVTCFAWDESNGLPVFHTHGAWLTNLSAAGETWYGNFDLHPTASGPLKVPHYCPAPHAQPKFNATDSDLAKVCKRGWLKTDPNLVDTSLSSLHV